MLSETPCLMLWLAIHGAAIYSGLRWRNTTMAWTRSCTSFPGWSGRGLRRKRCITFDDRLGLLVEKWNRVSDDLIQVPNLHLSA